MCTIRSYAGPTSLSSASFNWSLFIEEEEAVLKRAVLIRAGKELLFKVYN